MNKFVSVLLAAALAINTACGLRHHKLMKKGQDILLTGGDNNANSDPIFWFDQRNDHFSKSDISTWKQQYALNTTLWGGAGYPIFVDLGGEGPMGSTTLSGKYVFSEHAAEAKAMLVSIEHRFYGKSTPGDGTLSTANLKKLLSADQALADYANLISYIKAKYNTPSSKVVTFGGSYSGSLSAWIRQKYPHVVHAALSSSAPVLAQLDYPEYLQVVTESIGAQCAARVRTAFTKIGSLIESEAGRAVLEKDFKACTKMESELDEVTFLESLTDNIAGVVQYSGDANSRGRLYDIDRMCGIIMNAAADAYEAYKLFVYDYMNSTGATCSDSSYAQQLKDLSNTDPSNPNAAGRSWVFQTCAEYGYYQTVETPDVPFSKKINLDYFLGMCKDLYGIDPAEPRKSVDYTNVYYGALNPHSSRIVFTNGSVDPWHALGNVKDFDENMPVYYIKGTAHCADLYASTPEDLPSLTEARTKTWNHIFQWLKEN